MVITPELIEKLDTLDNIKCSKVIAYFVSKEECRKQICQKMVFGKFMQRDNEATKCSICYDSTEIKTPCGHIICISC